MVLDVGTQSRRLVRSHGIAFHPIQAGTNHERPMSSSLGGVPLSIISRALRRK